LAASRRPAADQVADLFTNQVKVCLCLRFCMSRDLDTFSMDTMEEDPDDEIVAAYLLLL